MDLNLFAHYYASKKTLQIFHAQDFSEKTKDLLIGGQILFNISKQALNPGPNFGSYGIAKAALVALMRQISLEEGVDLVLHAFKDMQGAEIYVKKIPSMKVTDLASVVAPDTKQIEVGIRPGEKLHEQMIGEGDSASTYEYEEYYKILPIINGWDEDLHRIKEGKKVPEDFIYDSSTNDHWMSDEDLLSWIANNSEKLGKI